MRRAAGSGLHHMVWDWNGTLLDDVDLVVEIMGELLREHGLPALEISRYLEIFEFPAQKYYEKLGFGAAHPTFETVATRFMQQYNRRVFDCSLHADARQSLERFRERGVTNVVLTAGNQASVAQQFEHFGLRDLVSEVVGNTDDFAGSKDVIGTNWLRERRFDSRSMAYVGDTTHDYEVAKAMEVRCILVSHGHNSLARLTRCGCTVVPRLSALDV
jgi:phosphoglycolate phosphatase